MCLIGKLTFGKISRRDCSAVEHWPFLWSEISRENVFGDYMYAYNICPRLMVALCCYALGHKKKIEKHDNYSWRTCSRCKTYLHQDVNEHI